MTSRYSRAIRLLGLALLLLAVSPLTAPFSTCDLMDILGGATAPSSVSMQAKAAPDEPVAEVGAFPGLAGTLAVSVAFRSRALHQLHGSVPLTIPLRL